MEHIWAQTIGLVAMVHSAEEMTNELLSLGGIMRNHLLGNVWVIIEGMLGLSQHDYMYVFVDKNDGMKRRFFMSLGHDGDHPAASDHWCIYGWPGGTTRSLRSGASPSTFAPGPAGRVRSEAKKARWAAKARSPH